MFDINYRKISYFKNQSIMSYSSQQYIFEDSLRRARVVNVIEVWGSTQTM